MQKKTSLFLIAIIVLLSTSLFGNSKISKIPNGVSIYQLDNGIEVLLIENPALPMIGVNTIVKVGSAYETFSTSGMSHMLEHLLFNGTSTMTQRELYDLTDKIGGYNNANTSEYYTNFMMVTPSDKIEEGMKIQAGMLFDSTLPLEKFEKEKGIVLEEIAKSLANSKEQLYRNTIDVIYHGHALSLPTLGTYETIENMDRDYVYDFYKNNYVPNNMLMSVIGNFKTDEMLKLVKNIYGKAAPENVERPNIADWGTGFDMPKKDNQKLLKHKFYSGEKTHLQHFYNVENISPEFFDLLELSFSKQKYGVKKTLDEKYPDEINNIKISILNSPVKSFVELDLELNDSKNIEMISNTLNEELQKLNFALTNKIIEAEAIKVRTKFLKQIEKPHMFGIYNANLIAQNGLDVIIDAFSSSGIYAAGKALVKYKIKGKPQIIIQHPKVNDGSTKSADVIVELFENDANGSTVIAKQNTASDLLAIHYLFKYKADFEKKYKNDVAKKWHAAFGNRMKSAENQKKSSKYGLSFVVNDNPYIPMDNIYMSPTFGYIRVEGLANDIEGAIKYLNEEMLNFIPTEDEFNKVNSKKGSMSSMMGRKNKSKVMYDQAYKSLIFEPVVETSDRKILDYNAFKQFGKEYFSPNNIIISVVSNKSPEIINQYFKEFVSEGPNKFSGLANEKKIKKWDETKKIEKHGGGEQSHTFYGFVKNIEKHDKPALTILSRMMADDISFNIREKQGLAYRMSSGIKMVGDKALFYVNVPTQPKNVEKLLPQFEGLFNPDFANKKNEDDLEKTVNMYLGKMMFRRLSSINQAYYLAHSYYYEGDIKSDKENLEAIKNVKLNDVKIIAKKYLNIKNPIEIIIH